MKCMGIQDLKSMHPGLSLKGNSRGNGAKLSRYQGCVLLNKDGHYYSQLSNFLFHPSSMVKSQVSTVLDWKRRNQAS